MVGEDVGCEDICLSLAISLRSEISVQKSPQLGRMEIMWNTLNLPSALHTSSFVETDVAAAALSAKDEESSAVPSHPDHLVQSCHREHAASPSCLAASGPQITADGGKESSGKPSALSSINLRRCLSRGLNSIKDCSHPHHGLMSLFPSGRSFCSVRTRTDRFCISFPPKPSDGYIQFHLWLDCFHIAAGFKCAV